MAKRLIVLIECVILLCGNENWPSDLGRNKVLPLQGLAPSFPPPPSAAPSHYKQQSRIALPIAGKAEQAAAVLGQKRMDSADREDRLLHAS